MTLPTVQMEMRAQNAWQSMTALRGNALVLVPQFLQHKGYQMRLPNEQEPDWNSVMLWTEIRELRKIIVGSVWLVILTAWMIFGLVIWLR